VDDQLLVGSFNGLGDLGHQFNAFADTELLILDEPVDRHAMDALHDEVRNVAHRSYIDKCRYVGMLESSENPSFLVKSLRRFLAEPLIDERQVEELNCDCLVHLIVNSMGFEDKAHTAAAQQASEFKSADSDTRCNLPQRVEEDSSGADRLPEGVVCLPIVGEERQHLPAKLYVRTRFKQPLRALAARLADCFSEPFSNVVRHDHIRKP
jgi:hypothetical protein